MKVDYFDGATRKVDSEVFQKHMSAKINWKNVDYVREDCNDGIVIIFNNGKQRTFTNTCGNYKEVCFR